MTGPRDDLMGSPALPVRFANAPAPFTPRSVPVRRYGRFFIRLVATEPGAVFDSPRRLASVFDPHRCQPFGVYGYSRADVLVKTKALCRGLDPSIAPDAELEDVRDE